MALPIEIKFQSMGRHIALYYFLNPGDEITTHTHPVDHDIVVVAGRFQIGGVVDGKEISYEVEAPHKVYVQSPSQHSYKALTPNAITMNIFAQVE